MAYSKIRQARLLAGLCFQCGAERREDGSTKTRCADCVENQKSVWRAHQADPTWHEQEREASRKRHTLRRDTLTAMGLCVACRKARKGRGATGRMCGQCAQKCRVQNAAYQQKKRNEAMGYTPGDGRNRPARPLGIAARQFGMREGGAYHYHCILDRGSYDGLLALRQRYRDGETRAGRDWQTHQLSRLVREVIVRYEPSRIVLPPRKPQLLNEHVVYLSLDGRTRAVLERQAARSFGGNKAATLRAMLANCQSIRRAFTGRAGMRGR